MGGDDSQKLLPWRGIHSPPGRKPPAYYEINSTPKTASGKGQSISPVHALPTPSAPALSLGSARVSERPEAQGIQSADRTGRMLSPMGLE